MKKLILLILLLPSLCFGGSVQDAHKKAIGRKNATATWIPKDDPNCMAAYFMNGGLSANGDSETDRSGEGETLTEQSGDIPNSADVPAGYSGTSRAFLRANTEYLYHADAGSTDINGANQSISITAWIKAGTIANATTYAVVTKGDDTLTENQYKLVIIGTGVGTYKIQAGISINTTNWTTVDSTTTNFAAEPEAWHHIAMVYNDTDLRIYSNGVLNCTPQALTTGIGNGGTLFNIGAIQNNGLQANQFDGLIDEVAVFNDALSADEVLDIKTNGIDGSKGGND